MKSMFYLVIEVLLVGLILLPDEAYSGEPRPNVILILTDDQGYGEVGAHGNRRIKTPELDRLHDESVRLVDFHVNNVCSPSRAALLTGKYSTHVGVWHTLGGRDVIFPGETLMPQIFADNGYKTLMIGKWHVGDSFPFRPEDRGFNEVYRIGGGSPGQVADYWENNLFGMHYWNGKTWEKSQGFCTDTQFDAAIDFIACNKANPFFIYLSTTAVHSPTGAPEQYLSMYSGLPKEVQTFYGMVSNLDWNIGRLRSFLEENGMDENTILIFMTDNGSACDKKDRYGTYNAGMRGKKGSDYDGGHRVPCFVFWPGGDLARDAELKSLTAHIDWLPTLVEACNLHSDVSFDGTSILSLLRNPTQNMTRTLVTEGKVHKRFKPFGSSCVMRGDWRLIKGKELYNIATDPGQKNDLSAEHPEQVRLLRDAYKDWYSEMEKGFEKVSRSVIGDPQCNPARLYCMDLHPRSIAGKSANGKPIWNQKGVKKGESYHGIWKLDIAQSGTYAVSLRRFPAESGLAFNAVPHKGAAVEYKRAELNIGTVSMKKPIDMSSQKVTFHVDLTKGPADLDAVFVDARGQKTSAYYVEILKE